VGTPSKPAGSNLILERCGLPRAKIRGPRCGGLFRLHELGAAVDHVAIIRQGQHCCQHRGTSAGLPSDTPSLGQKTQAARMMEGDAGCVSAKPTDTGGEFKVGRLFTGVGSWRACFAAALGSVTAARMTGAGEAAEFATRSTARRARTIITRKFGTGVLLAVALRLYFLSRSTARRARTIMARKLGIGVLLEVTLRLYFRSSVPTRGGHLARQSKTPF